MSPLSDYIPTFLRRLLGGGGSETHPSTPLIYWRERAIALGPRSAIDLRYREDQYDAVTARQKKTLYPLLKSKLQEDEAVLVDFGCGPGRFTADLGRMLNGMAIGIDPVGTHMDWVLPSSTASFVVAPENEIPLPADSADVVWVCLVLGGITREEGLAKACDEIQRVLRPGGLLFLVENTSDRPDGAFWVYHSIEAYRALFSTISLEVLSSYSDFGESITVMAGRKHV